MALFPKLSVREKILLYLADRASPAETEPTLAATQIGIANATGLHRGHVSRALDALAVEGLVDKNRRRVPGFSRALLVCTLTPQGRQAAQVLRQGLEAVVVEARLPGAASARRPLGEYLRETPNANLWSALGQLEQDGFVAAPMPAAPRLGTAHVLDLEDAPVVHGFVGRSNELDQLMRWMRTLDPACIVAGPGGIGKSNLVAHAIQQSRPARHILWIRLSDGMNAERVLARLAAFLARLGRSLTAPPTEEPRAVLAGLPGRIKGLPILLVFDDVHKADEALREAFQGFAAAADRRGDLKVLWIGRTLRLPPEALRRPLRLELPPLTAAECQELLTSLAVPADQRGSIARRSAGNPLFLELLAASGSPQSAQEDFARHLVGDLERSAPAQEQSLLRHLCALRTPVAKPILERLGMSPDADLGRLVRFNILSQRSDGSFELHDEVRAAIYHRMSDAERRRIHAAWARAFEPTESLDTVLEFLHHLTLAGRQPEAAWWALRNQMRLLVWARAKFNPSPRPIQALQAGA